MRHGKRRGCQTCGFADARPPLTGKHQKAGAAGPIINVARSLRRRVGRINSEILLGSSCLLHTAETVLPRLI
jgi:hypothetical protein